jgi:hypothetical protein
MHRVDGKHLNVGCCLTGEHGYQPITADIQAANDVYPMHLKVQLSTAGLGTPPMKGRWASPVSIGGLAD